MSKPIEAKKPPAFVYYRRQSDKVEVKDALIPVVQDYYAHREMELEASSSSSSDKDKEDRERKTTEEHLAEAGIVELEFDELVSSPCEN
jgi:hypothetical protein